MALAAMGLQGTVTPWASKAEAATGFTICALPVLPQDPPSQSPGQTEGHHLCGLHLVGFRIGSPRSRASVTLPPLIATDLTAPHSGVNIRAGGQPEGHCQLVGCFQKLLYGCALTNKGDE